FDENSSKAFTNLDGLAVTAIQKLGRDTSGGIWAAANSRLRSFHNEHPDSESDNIPLSWPWHENETVDIVLQPAKDGGLWLAEPLRGSWDIYGGQIRRLKEGKWTGRFEPTPFERGSPKELEARGDRKAVSRSTVTTLLEDHSGRIWI